MHQFRGIKAIRAFNSTITLDARRHRGTPWVEVMPWVTVQQFASRPGLHGTRWVEGETLVFCNAEATLHLPARAVTHLDLQNNSIATGRFAAGTLSCDATSHMRLDVPRQTRERVRRSLARKAWTFGSGLLLLTSSMVAALAVGYVLSHGYRAPGFWQNPSWYATVGCLTFLAIRWIRAGLVRRRMRLQ